ncbi:MAG: VOC family protein [Chitinophagaceae bacterium]|nr:MAG: VOC family protein [Chitinophagaceae bacterium]
MITASLCRFLPLFLSSLHSVLPCRTAELYIEEAFTFYKSVFGGEFSGNGIMRFGDIPPSPDNPPASEDDKNLVMYVELRILGVHTLMGTDAPESMGLHVNKGNNMYINLQLDTRKDTEKYFKALAEGGKVEMELGDMFWGDYFGSLVDKFGIPWMFNCPEKA